MIDSRSELGIKIDNGIAVLEIKREAKQNALNDALMKSLLQVCHQIEHESEVKVVILTAAGTKSFSAGGDINAWSSLSAKEFGLFWIREGHAVFDSIARLRQPVIVVLNGHTLGGGLELACTGDYRIAEDHVHIGMPETSIGMIPGWSGTQRAVRRFGSQVIRKMALFGKTMTGTEALKFGLIDELVATGKGLEQAMAVAEKVKALSPTALELTKMLINAAEEEETERVLDTFAGMIALSSEDAEKGVDSFKKKTRPRF